MGPATAPSERPRENISDVVARFNPKLAPTGIKNNAGPLSKKALFMAAITLMRTSTHQP